MKQRIHLISDVHVEAHEFSYTKKPDADVVIVAGDCGSGLRGLEWISRTWPDQPVVYVAGNHEFYGELMPVHRLRLAQMSANPNVHFLDRKVIVINGIRYIGATLWTDFALDGDPVRAMTQAEACVSDYYEISMATGIRLKAHNLLDEHKKDRKFIEDELSKPFDGPTVVVTHHAPSSLSIHEQFLGDPITPCFVSDLEEVVIKHKPALWIHGHVHNSFDYRIGSTRVIANPRGYPEKSSTGKIGNENGDFDERLIVTF